MLVDPGDPEPAKVVTTPPLVGVEKMVTGWVTVTGAAGEAGLLLQAIGKNKKGDNKKREKPTRYRDRRIITSSNRICEFIVYPLSPI